jgi:hypothetical protein
MLFPHVGAVVSLRNVVQGWTSEAVEKGLRSDMA